MQMIHADQKLNDLTDKIGLVLPVINMLSNQLSLNRDDVSSGDKDGIIWILDRISESLTDMRKEADDGNP
jgi:hypothetical protein